MNLFCVSIVSILLRCIKSSKDHKYNQQDFYRGKEIQPLYLSDGDPDINIQSDFKQTEDLLEDLIKKNLEEFDDIEGSEEEKQFNTEPECNINLSCTPLELETAKFTESITPSVHTELEIYRIEDPLEESTSRNIQFTKLNKDTNIPELNQLNVFYQHSHIKSVSNQTENLLEVNDIKCKYASVIKELKEKSIAKNDYKVDIANNSNTELNTSTKEDIVNVTDNIANNLNTILITCTKEDIVNVAENIAYRNLEVLNSLEEKNQPTKKVPIYTVEENTQNENYYKNISLRDKNQIEKFEKLQNEVIINSSVDKELETVSPISDITKDEKLFSSNSSTPSEHMNRSSNLSDGNDQNSISYKSKDNSKFYKITYLTSPFSTDSSMNENYNCLQVVQPKCIKKDSKQDIINDESTQNGFKFLSDDEIVKEKIKKWRSLPDIDKISKPSDDASIQQKMTLVKAKSSVIRPHCNKSENNIKGSNLFVRYNRANSAFIPYDKSKYLNESKKYLRSETFFLQDQKKENRKNISSKPDHKYKSYISKNDVIDENIDILSSSNFDTEVKSTTPENFNFDSEGTFTFIDIDIDTSESSKTSDIQNCNSNKRPNELKKSEKHGKSFGYRNSRQKISNSHDIDTNKLKIQHEKSFGYRNSRQKISNSHDTDISTIEEQHEKHKRKRRQTDQDDNFEINVGDDKHLMNNRTYEKRCSDSSIYPLSTEDDINNTDTNSESGDSLYKNSSCKANVHIKLKDHNQTYDNEIISDHDPGNILTTKKHDKILNQNDERTIKSSTNTSDFNKFHQLQKNDKNSLMKTLTLYSVKKIPRYSL